MVYRNRMLLSLFLFCGAISAFGQTLENVKAAFDGEKMVITYDLGFTDANQKFKVAFYSSHDSYARPLSFITGDAGESVHVGKANKVIWDVKNTLPPDFDGDITIKIKTSKVVAVEAVTKLSLKPLDRNVYKKGQTVQVEWKGGKPSDKIHIDLYKDGTLQQKLTESLGNSPQLYQWMLPKDLKGSGYSFRIANSSDQTNSGNFKVKPKIPLMLKVLPVLMIGGVVVALGGSKSTITDQTPNIDLPGPIKPN